MHITDDDIRDLRDEAGSAGDLNQVRVCGKALAGNREAREECERVIDSAAMRAAEDSA